MPDPISPYEPVEHPGLKSDSGNNTAVERNGNGAGAQDYDPSAFAGDSIEPEVVPPSEGLSPSEEVPYEPVWIPVARPRVRTRIWLHASLFAVTILTTTLVGIDHWLSYVYDFGAGPIAAMSPAEILAQYTHHWYVGFWYSATILLILGAHELGHYFACRYYHIDASLPYFLPLPPPFPLTGTLGAFIRIRQPVTSKRQLFDIGIAGPLAGFFFAVPALFVGLALSHVARVPPDFSGLELGEPLLFKLATALVWGPIPQGYSLNLHPMAFAAWFGLLATALNLFPIGQLDGGHICYTVLGRHSTIVTLVMMGVAVVLASFSASLVVWAVLLVVMLFAFGAKHPPVIDERLPLDATRTALAIVALAVFLLSFTPAPIQPLDLIK